MCSSNPSARRVGHSLGRPDLVLVTLERDHPETAFAELGKRTDPFTMWFKRQVSEIHGMDLGAPPPNPMPQQMIDSES
jgi:hypothetical protein